MHEPCYQKLLRTGELEERAALAWQQLTNCDLCARYCRVNRQVTIKGAVCHTGSKAIIHGFGAHHGEENPLRGWNGSGTIFFSWCNLHCVFCQNWEISHSGRGREVSAEELGDIMVQLQFQGCHNINLVSPSHTVAQIIAAVLVAAKKGLHIPIVYNTGGYDSLEALALLDGIVDIYMPDMKYGNLEGSHRFSKARDYVKVNSAAVREMHRQVGNLVLDPQGIALRGLLVRHLVLPGGSAGSEQILAFLAREISPDTYINLMDQYRPCYRADEYPPLNRPLTQSEYREAQSLCRRYGLWRLDKQ